MLKNVIFFLDSSLALFTSIFCQRRLVEEEFLSENLMLFSQTFFLFTLYDMSVGLMSCFEFTNLHMTSNGIREELPFKNLYLNLYI